MALSRFHLGVFSLAAAACLAGIVVGCSQNRERASTEPGPPPTALQTPAPAPAPGDSSAGEYPRFGDWVYVEVLPDVIAKVPPEYPEKARKANVEGVVNTQALLGKDGLVKDVKIISSPSPLLEAAAVDAIRKWVFRPAMAYGKPVAVWVAVPVTFTLE